MSQKEEAEKLEEAEVAYLDALESLEEGGRVTNDSLVSALNHTEDKYKKRRSR